MITEAGFTVISRWGMRETTENLLKASGASVNWVVNASGFRLARYMEAEFGIPYIVGAPFGVCQCDTLLQALKNNKNVFPCTKQESPEVIVIGEQLTAGAIRCALWKRGFKNIRVLSFYDMDKSWMQPGDAKLNSEDDLAMQAQADSVQRVFADPDYKAAVKRDVPWAALPNIANQSSVNGIDNFNMAGGALDEWLDGMFQDWRKA